MSDIITFSYFMVYKKIRFLIIILSLVLISVIIFSVRLLKIGFVSDYWPLALSLPLAIILVYYSRQALKMKMKYIGRSTLFIGIIALVILLYATVMMLLFSKFEKKDFRLVDRIEEVIDFELPNEGSIITKDFSNSSFERSRYKSLSKVFFYDGIEDLENRIINSEKWTSNLDSKLKVAIPIYLLKEDANFYLLYNIDNETFHSAPIKGKNNYLLIYYYDNGEMTIVEYKIEISEG